MAPRKLHETNKNDKKVFKALGSILDCKVPPQPMDVHWVLGYITDVVFVSLCRCCCCCVVAVVVDCSRRLLQPPAGDQWIWGIALDIRAGK